MRKNGLRGIGLVLFVLGLVFLSVMVSEAQGPRGGGSLTPQEWVEIQECDPCSLSLSSVITHPWRRFVPGDGFVQKRVGQTYSLTYFLENPEPISVLNYDLEFQYDREGLELLWASPYHGPHNISGNGVTVSGRIVSPRAKEQIIMMVFRVKGPPGSFARVMLSQVTLKDEIGNNLFVGGRHACVFALYQTSLPLVLSQEPIKYVPW